MYTKLILDLPVAIFVPVEYQLHMTVRPKHRDAYGIRWRTIQGGLSKHKTAANVRDRI